MVDGTAFERVDAWFHNHGWSPFPFQRQVWDAYLEGRSGLIHSATGTGKTYAAWMGPVIEALSAGDLNPKGLRVLWITPLRALASDTVAALKGPLADLGLYWEVGMRTGDTSTTERQRQKERLPAALVTTPESFTLMLSTPEARRLLSGVRAVIVDEWHELMASKRGVQTELALARLRRFSPGVRTWGISATLGNLTEAMEVLLGVQGSGFLLRSGSGIRIQPETEGRDENSSVPSAEPCSERSRASRTPDSEPNPSLATRNEGLAGTSNPEPRLVQGEIPKEVIIDTLLPDSIDRFPWAGHIGTKMLPQVIQAIEESTSALLFTNTRSQTEIWFQAILAARPDWKGKVEIHHGSLDREVRDAVEMGIKTGVLRAVVCTSSLDLGVDFTPVDRVLQMGSPKGVARLLQRAGRSGHQPGVPSRITCVPTLALEMMDVAGIRDAARQGRIEARPPIENPLDVLVQHLVTIALGEGFTSDDLYQEVRETYSYQELSKAEWDWALDFVTRGGPALRAYPEYKKVVLKDGRYVVENPQIAKRHRMSIGTISSDAAMHVQYMSGGRLGTIEESFISRLNHGDKFIFSGKALQFVRVKDMTALVKPAKGTRGAVPRWMGGRIPLSTELAVAIREKLGEAKYGDVDSPEMQMLAPLLELQQRWSALPGPDEVLIEQVETREGFHIFIYPVEGRLVHEGLAALFAYRISMLQSITFSIACNDYGFEMLSGEPARLEDAIERGLMTLSFEPPGMKTSLLEDIYASLNAAEMAKRQFRDIARVAGLIFQGYPGSQKSTRQVQASSGLFFDVFSRYDPGNMLLAQANREVLERQLGHTRLAMTLERLATSRILMTEPPRPTPLAFPILVDRLRETVSSETISARIERMTMAAEKAAG